MNRFVPVSCISVCLLVACQAAPAGTWYIPIEEQVPGGFDHIQILAAYPYSFDATAMTAFCGPAAGSEDWSETFINSYQTLATADGPDPGGELLYFSIWVAGDPQADRPAFHYQAYRGNLLVDNADIVCWGPGELEWMVAPGTWPQTSAMPPWMPGDADVDLDVDLDDMIIVAQNWKKIAAQWTDGNFNGDITVDKDDLEILARHWTGVGAPPVGMVPEPGALILMALGMGLATMARRRKT